MSTLQVVLVFIVATTLLVVIAQLNGSVKRARKGRSEYYKLYRLCIFERDCLRAQKTDAQADGNKIRLAIWGTPILYNRELRDVLKWITNIKKEYAECQYANTVMVATLQNYSHQLREKSGYIGELRKEMEEIRKGRDEFELAYVELKEAHRQLQRNCDAIASRGEVSGEPVSLNRQTDL